jgi:hypothetical protein
LVVSYIGEALRCFRGSHLRASVMLGVARGGFPGILRCLREWISRQQPQ